MLRTLISLGLAGAAACAPLLARQDSTPLGLDFPAGNLSVPAGATLKALTIGIGYQNYTCSSAGVYANNQAFARLYDASSLANGNFAPSDFDQLPADALSAWSAQSNVSSADYLTFASTSETDAADAAAHSAAPVLSRIGSHFFIGNATVASPEFVVGNQSVVCKKNATLTSPDGSIAWLELANATASTFAQYIYRTHTAGGKPPASCNSNDSSTLQVAYAAAYVFLGSS